MVTTSNVIRRRFKELTNEKACNKQGIRWHMWFEVSEQFRKHLKIIQQTLAENLGAERLRVKLAALLAYNQNTIKLELAIVADAC